MKNLLHYFVTKGSLVKKYTKITSLCLCMFITGISYAQDVITLRNGTEIEGKVIEIGPFELKYSTAANLQIQRSLAKTDVFMIKYANGTKEIFEAESKPQAYQAPAAPFSVADNKFDPDTSDFAKMRQKRFSGPRVGFTLLGNGTTTSYLDEINKRRNFVSFGWQFETVLFTAGNMSGLVEFVPLIGGFEQGLFIPSVNVLLGLRGGEKHIFEFAMGPNFSVGRDHQGDAQGTVGLVIAIGTGFRKEKVNFPITFALVPSVGSKHDVTDEKGNTTSQDFETGWKFSLLVGFNNRKR
jgi:hypothetical protein